MTPARRGAAAAIAAALLGVLVVAAPGAEAASYRYWTYWWGQPGSTSWTFAQLGPSSDRPKDGSVVGWRFAVTTESGGRKPPRAQLPFSSLCPSLDQAPSGSKRVAVVVDYGTTSDAPPGQSPPGGGTVRVECVTVPTTATGVQVLNTAKVIVRWGTNGLVCALDGYPRNECAAIVADPEPSPTPTRTRTSSPKPTATATTSASQPASTASTSLPGGAMSASASSGSTSPSESAASRSAAATSASPTPATDVAASEEPLPVSSGAPVAAGDDGAGGSPVGVLVGMLMIAAIGAGAWWTARGRSS